MPFFLTFLLFCFHECRFFNVSLVSAVMNVVSFKFKLLVSTFMNDVLSCFSFFMKSIKA